MRHIITVLIACVTSFGVQCAPATVAAATTEITSAGAPAPADTDAAELERALVSIDWSAESPQVPQQLAARLNESQALRMAGLRHYRIQPSGAARFNIL